MSNNSITQISKEEEILLEKNLVWIFASPRSGTHWMARLLSYKTRRSDGPSIGVNLGFTHPGFEDKIVRYIDFRADSKHYFLSQNYKPIWKYHLRKLILDIMYTTFEDISNKIIIDDPDGSMASDIISECLPDSKIIVLLRDGRDVIDSIVDALKEGSWNIKKTGRTPITAQNRNVYIKKFSKEWVKQTEILQKTYESHSKDLRLKVRYEDLLQDTENQLKKIYNFIGINIPGEALKKLVKQQSFENIPEDKKGPGKVFRSASPGKWKENFSETEQEMMNQIMSETLKKIGYSFQ